MTVRTLKTDRGDAGVRLDLVLRRHLADEPAATRTRIQAWIEAGCVTVNGTPVRRVSSRAAFGDRLAVAMPDAPARATMQAERADLDVLYEDDDLIAVNKPAGIVVHPGYRNPAGTLMNALLWRARDWPRGTRPSIVGRLDKLTSGLVVAAKTPAAHAALQRALASSDAAKDYLALVYGRAGARGVIDLRLRRADGDRRRVVVSADTGLPSRTRFTRLARAAAPACGLSLLLCRLATGRTHQIRVHLAARGWPIVGDPTYGEPRWTRVADPALAAALRAFPRQALHAWRLGFTHPSTGARVTVEAPLPDDLRTLLDACGFSASSTAPPTIA